MKRSIALIASLALAGCSMGPRHIDAHPALPADGGAGASLAPITPEHGPVQTIAVGADAPSTWWTSFACPGLDRLVDQALHANEDIHVAEATLRQTQELAAAAGGAALPQIDGSYQAQRARTSAGLAPPVTDPNQLLYSLHSAQLTITYPLDIFGGVHSKIRSAHAAADVQRYRLRAARQTAVANLVNAVILRASLAAQIDATRASIAANRDILILLQKRQALGTVGAADVSTQQTALALAETALPPLLRAETHERALIAILLGQPAGTDIPDLPGQSCLALPRTIPVAIPSALVARRPDILAAGAQLAGAGADLGTAIAARLPSIQLTASAGGIAQDFGSMFVDGNPFWSLIGGITQPIFHAGALLHQQHAAEAALDVTKAQYRAAVLQAFLDVSDALTGLRTDAQALDASDRAASAAAKSFGFAKRQLELGDAGTLTVLTAAAANAQAQAQLIQARSARLSDMVALYQASGGGID
ncbi:efflux transporter outer membrane subunit [Sphingobium sp. EM0848]|uniref:efflux transporter outer membrane subunit n=1 Tax=Sphingobium sp. EM0848 TaxID=2743473 RepID=UPI00159CAA02|nr:efflux transporter outer membrane subunit [Sphingobium sp. EM0848]